MPYKFEILCAIIYEVMTTYADSSFLVAVYLNPVFGGTGMRSQAFAARKDGGCFAKLARPRFRTID